MAVTSSPIPDRPPATAHHIRPPQHRLDRRFILWRTLQAIFWGTGVLAAVFAVYWKAESTRPWLGPLLVILAVIYAVNILFMPTIRYLIHRWETTDEAVYVLQGWLTKEWRIVPVARIQSVDVEAGLIQRLLGIATVTITTASSAGKVTIEGLSAETTQAIIDHLNVVIRHTPGDAT